MLFYESGEPFSNGLIKYEYRPATEWDNSSRILVPVKIDGIEILALLDTGAPYVVCTPEIAAALNLDPAAALGPGNLQWHGRLSGLLYRQPIILLAEQGNSIQVETTMFVPNPESSEAWEYGRRAFVIGMGGCLERLRFAIDPEEDIFYFGQSGW